MAGYKPLLLLIFDQQMLNINVCQNKEPKKL